METFQQVMIFENRGVSDRDVPSAVSSVCKHFPTLYISRLSDFFKIFDELITCKIQVFWDFTTC